MDRLVGWLKAECGIPNPHEMSRAKVVTLLQKAVSTRRGRPKKTEKDSDAKVVSALNVHHGYENGSVTNPEPATNRGLAEMADLSNNALTRFLKARYPGESDPFKKYRVACRDRSIGTLLALWNRELPARLADLYKDEEQDSTRKHGQHRRGRSPGCHRDDD
jgi:hypothetical protein